MQNKFLEIGAIQDNLKTHICTQARQFFPKLWYFLSIFKAKTGETSHPPPCLLRARVKRGRYSTNFFLHGNVPIQQNFNFDFKKHSLT